MGTTKESKVRWIDGLQFAAESGSGHAIVLDAPEPTGRNTGPSPMELLLMGLAGCTAVDVVSILRKKRQALRTVEVFARGVQRDKAPKVFTNVELEYVVYGTGISAKAVEQAIGLSETKYCSAAGMMNAVVEITTKYRIVEE